MSGQKSSENIKTIIIWLLKLAFAATSFFFIRQALNDYLQKKKYFHPEIQPLTDADMPTLTICLENEKGVKLGTDFNISILNSDLEPWVALDEDGLDVTYNDGSPWFSIGLKLMSVYQEKAWVNRDCIKLNPLRAPLPILDLVGGKLLFQIVYSNRTITPEEALLYITSEENAYGAIFLKWYDGKVHPYTLKKGKMHYLRIFELLEYKHITSSCKDKSYYECIASKLEDHEHFQINDCSGFTLPAKAKFEYLPNCNSTQGNLTTVSQNIIYNYHFDPDICKGDIEKSCTVQEYFLDDWGKPYPFDDDEASFTFQCFYGLPESSGGRRIGRPSKKVYTEYFQMDVFGLIGTIGGTLGLTIGFSLVTFISWASESAVPILLKLKSFLSRYKADGNSK